MAIDCYEPLSHFAVDYHPESYYSYDGINKDNIDIHEFYDRLYLNEKKKEQLVKTKVKYIEVPYTVDMCEETGDGLVCRDYVSTQKRREKIRNYLEREIVVN